MVREVNRFAYLSTGIAVRALSSLSKARVRVCGQENIPNNPTIYVINHFTRIETLILPYYIYQYSRVPVWSLADYSLFKGALGSYLDQVGAVSTKDPHRDILIVKTLMTGTPWIIFPEGCMVKNKKIFEKGQLMITDAWGHHPPHTGAATLALRTEFYRQRICHLKKYKPDESKRIADLFGIEDMQSISSKDILIMPVNITYYPIRARENILSKLAESFVEDTRSRAIEEIMTEGTMLLSGVDMDIRFGKPFKVCDFMKGRIERDVRSPMKFDFDDPIPSKRLMKNAARKVMERYMTEIYGMTTINHDHLFASMLKMTPANNIDITDLKRRVFLVTQELSPTNAFLHTSLCAGQAHLLTDDRYNKFRDFLAAAINTGIVKKNKNILIKDKSKFTAAFDFHHVRIENPLSVMANEVEPLIDIQKLIKRIARMSNRKLKKKIAYLMLKKALSEFDEDYKKFYVKDESKEKSVGAPFLLKGKSGKPGVLIIHGYMAAPLEIRELALYLAGKDFWVYAPRLKGHGTSTDDLALRNYQDWVESVEQGYAVIRNLCKNVIVGGFSLGAALALDLVTRINDIKGVFVVCTPLRLQDIASRFAPAVDTWNRLMTRVHFEGAKKEFVETQPENPHINYFRSPISGVKSIETLVGILEPKLPSIKIPALVAQAYKDPVVNPKSSRLIFEQIGSEQKEYILFNFDRHCIVLGKGSQRVHQVIGNFIEHL